MTQTIYFITHADVVMDKTIPVPRWPLSERGRQRHQAFNAKPFIADISAVYASDEQKAQDGARILAAHLGLNVQTKPALHENDRSATGFLPPAEFEAVADAFFQHPQQSVRGWEKAIDAQQRIVSAVSELIAQDNSAKDIAIVAHGGVGALLLCHLKGVEIDRQYDQPASGGGNYYAFEKHSLHLLHDWQAIDAD